MTYIREPILLGIPGKTTEHFTKSGKYKFGGKGNKLIGRILSPEEFIAIRNVIVRMYEGDRKGADDELTMFDCLLLCGCRYEEMRRVQRDSKCLQNDFLVVANKKPMAIQASGDLRHVRLSSKGKTIIRFFFKTDKRLPSVHAYNLKLKRWAKLANVSPAHLSVRVLRKTWESWLNVCYPQYTVMISKSQGHTPDIAYDYYVEMPFTDKDIDMMKDWVEGWTPKEVKW